MKLVLQRPSMRGCKDQKLGPGQKCASSAAELVPSATSTLQQWASETSSSPMLSRYLCLSQCRVFTRPSKVQSAISKSRSISSSFHLRQDGLQEHQTSKVGLAGLASRFEADEKKYSGIRRPRDDSKERDHGPRTAFMDSFSEDDTAENEPAKTAVPIAVKDTHASGDLKAPYADCETKPIEKPAPFPVLQPTIVQDGSSSQPSRLLSLGPVDVAKLQDEEYHTSHAEHRFAKVDPVWSSNFARINAPFQPGFQPETMEDDSPLDDEVFYFTHHVAHFEKLLQQNELGGHIYAAWRTSSPMIRERTWRNSLLLSLLHSPPDALSILNDILERQEILVPPYIFHDALEYLVITMVEAPKIKPRSNLTSFLDTAFKYLEQYSKSSGAASLSQRTLYILSQSCEPNQIEEVLKRLSASKSQVSLHTVLRFAERLISFDQLGAAFALLKTLSREELSMDEVQGVCVKMLRTKWNVENLYQMRTNLVSALLELGMQPNRQLLNVIIMNAVEAGDHDTAWNSYKISRDNGKAPDAFTLGFLLKSLDHNDDLLTVNSIYQEAKQTGVITNEYLMSHLLHSVYRCYNARNKRPFEAMLAMYSEVHDTSVFHDLGITIPVSVERRNTIPSRPGAHGLCCMLMAWLQEHWDSPEWVYEVYKRYVHHVNNQHPAIASMAATTHATTAFLIAFGKHKSSLHLCTKVVQDMLKPLIVQPPAYHSNTEEKATVEDFLEAQDDASTSTSSRDMPLPSESYPQSPPQELSTGNANSLAKNQLGHADHALGSVYPVAPPNIFTWNALMLAFARHKNQNAAAKIVKIMEKMGQRPDLITYNTLLGGYVETQQNKKVANLIQQMEKANFKPDDFTLRAMSFTPDREGLMAALGKAAAEQAAEAARGAKEEAARRAEGYYIIPDDEVDGV